MGGLSQLLVQRLTGVLAVAHVPRSVACTTINPDGPVATQLTCHRLFASRHLRGEPGSQQF